MAEGFNIQKFRSVIESYGVQKNNKFLVRFFMPSALRQSFGGEQDQAKAQSTAHDLQFWCDSAVLPGIQMQMRQVLRYGYGPVEKKPFAPGFNDATFTIMGDQMNTNWSWFHHWL